MRRDVAWGRERGLCVPGVSTRGLQRHPLHREPDRNRGALDGDNRPGCPGVVRLRRRAALIRGLLCAWARGIRRSRGLVHAAVSACGTAGHPRLGGRLPAFAKNARRRCQDRRKNQHGGQWPHPTHKPRMVRNCHGVKQHHTQRLGLRNDRRARAGGRPHHTRADLPPVRGRSRQHAAALVVANGPQA